MTTQICGSMSKHPVSLGRTMHEAGYRALGLNYLYAPFRCVDAEGAVRGIRALSIRGMGVSMPYKLDVIPHLDALSPLASRIGAVNTIVNDEGRLTGHNTDAIGAADALEEVLPLPGQHVLLLGSGGAARAILHGLEARGAKVTLSARNNKHASDITENTLPWESRNLTERFNVIVNATSLGMSDPLLKSLKGNNLPD